MVEVHHELSEKVFMWVGRDNRPAELPYVSETFIKGDGYVLHSVQRWLVFKSYLVPDIELQCRQYGHKSPRPYLPGQRCDGSIAAPVMFLLDDFCKRQGIDARLLNNQAYDYEAPTRKQEWENILAFAQWQGVQLPSTWNRSQYNLLQASLTAINVKSLSDLLDEVCQIPLQ